METDETVLYYAHDPMCSWCWGFRPAWQVLQESLTGKVNIQYLLGGLAPDTDQLMPAQMQANIRDTWRNIQQEISGTQFNFDFWTNCQPRRATYPACRAIIATRLQAPEREMAMLLAIQQAYYLRAKNPSDNEVLLELASETGLDLQQFENDMNSERCQQILQEEILQCRKIDITGFPSLVLKQGKSYTSINISYTNSNSMLNQILSALPDPG